MRNFIAAMVTAALGFSASGSDQGFVYNDAKVLLEQNPNLEFDPGSLLVRFAPGTPDQWKARAREIVGGQRIRAYTIVEGLEHITIAFPIDQARQVLEALPFVEYAEPDYFVRHCATPNDTHFGNQWGLHNTGQWVNGLTGINDADIDAPEGWNILTGSSTFVVAVLDTGTLWNHSDLAANIWTNPGEIAGNGIDDDANGYIDDIRGWDFYSNDNNPNDSDGHGTHTAGTVGAIGNNGIGVAGVAWNIKVMPLRFLGPGGGTTSDAIEAIQYIKNKNVKVSNHSWGSYGNSSSLSSAIQGTQSIGHVFVAAAGNDTVNNNSSPFFPASYTHANIISVAATTSKDQIAWFSNFGSTSVDLGAPGENILSTYLSNGYAYADGTSMASPHVAGVAALVYIKNPGYTYQQVKAAILDSTRPIAALSGKCVTGGVVNLAGALGSATSLPPVVSISSPSNNASFPAGSPVTFLGAAVDPEEGDLSASLIWSSNLQGQIGTGATFIRSDLAQGTHLITAQVTDATGNVASQQRTIHITQSAPAAPSDPAVSSPSEGNAQFTWTDNANNEASFTIQRQEKIGTTWTNLAVAGTVPADTTLFNDAPGVGTFRYRVRANNSSGSSAWTAWKQVNTLAKPAAPTNPVSTNLGGGQAQFSWTDNSASETGFTVQRQQKIGTTWTPAQVVATTAADATSIVDAPGPGQFRYRVRAFNSAGFSTWTAWKAVTVN